MHRVAKWLEAVEANTEIAQAKNTIVQLLQKPAASNQVCYICLVHGHSECYSICGYQRGILNYKIFPTLSLFLICFIVPAQLSACLIQTLPQVRDEIC